jgi:hypothetical protein
MKRILYIIIPLLGLLCAFNARAGIIIRPVLNTGLVGYWDFNESAGNVAYDKSGKMNTGTWAGTGTTYWVDGKIGKAGNFNGSNNYIQTTNDTIITSGAHTLCAWVKTPAPFLDAYIIGTSYPFWFGVASWGDYGHTKVFISNDDTSTNATSNAFTDNAWHYVCGIRYSDNTATLYVDGLQSGAVKQSAGTVSAGTDNFRIGATLAPGNFMNGLVDEFRIYNRALSESEIERLYKLSQPKMGINQLGLVPNDLPSNATISYVREDCSGYSPCYHSLYDWEAAFGGFDFADHSCGNGDLTCLDKTAVAKIDGAWNSPDPDAGFIIDGWVTNSSNYIYIYTTASARHPGKWDEAKYRLETTGSTITINDEYIRISGLQIKMTTASDYQRAVMSNVDNTNSDVRISDNIIRGVCSDSIQDCTGIGTNWNSVVNIKIWNNILYNLENGIYINQGAVAQVYNNTVVDGLDGYTINGVPIVIAKNNLAYNNTDNYDDGGGRDFDDYSTNNLSGPGSDDFIPSTNARNGVRVNFVDEANDDFHLSPADSGARNYGADLSNDASISFPFDIDRQDRKGAWDIGADEARGTIVNSSQTDKLTNSLVGYWPFNGPDIDGNTAYDRSTSGNNGTITGATPTDGKVGQALTFDGTGDYVYVTDPGSSDFDFSNGDPITLSAWLKPGQIRISDGLLFKDGTWGMQMYVDTYNGPIFTFYSSSWVSYMATLVYDKFSIGQWYHVVFTYTFGAGSSAKFYINGQQVNGQWSGGTGSEAVTPGDDSFKIGRAGAGEDFKGIIDEARVYNRVLSAEEIKRLYNLGR